MDSFPLGTVMGFIEGRLPPGWWIGDGRRLKRKQDPPLYDELRGAGFHKKYRTWYVFLPDYTYAEKVIPGPPQVRYVLCIKGSR